MKLVVRASVLCAALVSFGAAARADKVVARTSYWTRDGGRILSDVLVARDDGRIESMTVPGGTVDGIGMIELPLAIGTRFVNETDRSHSKLHWGGSCVSLTPDAGG